MFGDFHVHTVHSFDGKMTMEEACAAAVRQGMDTLCFTEHFSVLEYDPSYRVLRPADYARELADCRERYAGRLLVLGGLEIGEPHLETAAIARETAGLELDFVIGSLHNIGRETLRKFQAHTDTTEAYRTYFDTVRTMVRTADVDVLGHLDLMKRYVPPEKGNYVFADHAACIDDILHIAVQRGIGLEINASGLRTPGEFFPKTEVLRRYRELGGEIVTYGSDAHRPDAVGQGFAAACDTLRACGFAYLCRFERRRPQFFPL